MTRYIALIDGEPGAYGVVVPDLPGAAGMGDTIDDAVASAIEGVRLWVETAIEGGKKVPPARPIEIVRKDKAVAKALREGAVLASVPLVMNTGRAVRINLSLDSGTLAAIDEAANARGLTRSAFLASAARQKIAHEAG
ncbi:MAG TPA: type II toxin-antitoxin system HicB family antitoxin [Xanthobacteraceae bacterium]|jgi:predicted RNase H-like HicB family nuclease